MVKSARITLSYLAALFVFTVTAVVLRTVALITSLDETLIYFDNSIAIAASAICIALFSVCALSYFFVQNKDFKPAVSFENAQTYIPSGLVGVSFILMGFHLWGEILSMDKRSTASSFTSVSSIILLGIAVLAVISTVNFFLNCFQEKRESTARAAFCLCCALFMGFYAGHLFFSDALPINAPNKYVDQLAYLALAIFTLYETRISLGRSIWRAYVVFGLIATSLAFYSALPSIIYYFVSGNIVSNSLAENILTLTLGIYTASRLTLTLTAIRDEMCPTALAITDMTNTRDSHIKDNERLYGKITPKEDEEGPGEGNDGENYEFDFFELSNFTSDNHTDTKDSV